MGKKEIMRLGISLLFCSLSGLLFASCNSNKQVKEGEKADVRFLTETSLPDEGASVPTIENKEHKQLPESDARFASSGNELGIKLFELLCKERGNDRNTLLSPISIETVLGMNALALSDEAFAEYRTIMGLPESTKAEEVAGYLKRINAVLATADKKLPLLSRKQLLGGHSLRG